MSDSIVEKVRNLVSLASNDGAAAEEARTAALEAIKLISKNDLTVVAKADVEKVNKKLDALSAELDKMRKDQGTRTMIAAAAGYAAAKFLK
jgi:hypothetical protein